MYTKKIKLISFFVFLLLFSSIVSSIKLGITTEDNGEYYDSFENEDNWICTNCIFINEHLKYLMLEPDNGEYDGEAILSNFINSPDDIYKIKVEGYGFNGFGDIYNAHTIVYVTVDGGNHWEEIVDITGATSYSINNNWDVPSSQRGDQLKIRIYMREDAEVTPHYMSWIRVTYWYGSTTNNNAPNVPCDESPEDDDENVALPVTLSVRVSDPDGDSIDVSFYDDSTDDPIGTDEDISSGNRASVVWTGLSKGKTYRWYVKADDGELITRGPVSGAWTFETEEEVNYPPNEPYDLSGPSYGSADWPYDFSFKSDDPNGDDIQYKVKYRDSSYTVTDFFSSGEEAFTYLSWGNPGEYEIRVKAIDEYGAESDWVSFPNKFRVYDKLPDLTLLFWETYNQRIMLDFRDNEPAPGNEYRINIVIKNRGTDYLRAGENFWITYKFDDSVIQEKYVELYYDIPPNTDSNHIFSNFFIWPDKYSHTVSVKIDPDNDILECSETNNFYYRAYKTPSYKDKSISEFDIFSSFLKGLFSKPIIYKLLEIN